MSRTPADGAVFVYGTLIPGHLRWPVVADRVLAHEPDAVTGRLYDTGRGYPAADLDADGTIPGVRLQLDETTVDATLALLDRVEGPGYRRRRVRCRSGVAAWCYGTIDPVTGLVPIDAWGDDRPEA